MPVYKGRREGTHRIVVWAKGEPHEEIFEGSKTDAKEHEARMRIALRARGRTSQRIAPAFSNFCVEEYAPHASARLAASTWRVRESSLARLIEHFGATSLSDFSTELIDGFSTKQLTAGLRPSYINTDLTILGAVLHWAAEDRKQSVGEFRIRLLSTDERRVHCWTAMEVDRLLSTARKLDPFFEPHLLFLLNTGMRKNESVVAEWSWIDWRARLLRIPVTRFWRPKGKRPREVPIGDALLEMLKRRKRTTSVIFPTPEGDPFKAFPDWRFRPLAKAARLQGSPHCCRHTYASHFLQALPDLRELAAVLGHSQLRTTELYSHLLPGHAQRGLNAVNFGGSERVPRRRAG